MCMYEDLLVYLEVMCKKIGLFIELEWVLYFLFCFFYLECVDNVCEVLVVLGYKIMDVVFGVGYDVIYVVCFVLVGMIFVFCKDGVFYNEIEDVCFEYLEVGCNVLLQVMLVSVGVVID